MVSRGGGYTDDWCTHIILYNSYSIRDYLILVADDLCYVSDVKLQYLIWLLDPPHPRCSDKNNVGVPTFAGMIAQLCGTLQPATVKDSIQTLQTNQVNCLLSSTAISCLSLFIKLCVYASGKSYSICRNVCVRARVCVCLFSFVWMCVCVCVLWALESRAPGQRDSRSLRGTQTCIKLTSFIRSTVLASHNDWQIIAELDFRCIYFLFKNMQLVSGPIQQACAPGTRSPFSASLAQYKQTALGQNRPPHLSVAMHACDAA